MEQKLFDLLTKLIKDSGGKNDSLECRDRKSQCIVDIMETIKYYYVII